MNDEPRCPCGQTIAECDGEEITHLRATIAHLRAVIEEARARLERDIQDTTAELVILEGHPNATDGQIGRCAAKRSEAKDLLAILAKAEQTSIYAPTTRDDADE